MPAGLIGFARLFGSANWICQALRRMQLRDVTPWLRYGERQAEVLVDTVLLHATATETMESAVRVLVERGLSYHFLVDRTGEVARCVPSGAMAFHAGESFGPNGPSVNRYSVGIALVNRNDGLERYPHEQIDALVELVRSESEVFRWLTTHAEVSPGRKSDPLGLDSRKVAERCALKYWTGR